MTNIAVVGAGLIGERHIRAVIENPNCVLGGIVEPDASRRVLDDVQYFADMTELGDDIDGVILATPTGLHADQGIYAASRGWAILMEKPVAATIDDAQRLAAKVDVMGVASLVGHHRRYHPSVQKLRDLVSQGALGRIVNASMIWAVRKPDDYFANNWRAGEGSPVMINLVHDLDVLRFVLGEVTDVRALGSNGIRNASRIESGAAVLRFETGAVASISFADTAPSPWGFEAGMGENPNIATTHQDMMWITGTKASISFPSMTMWSGAQDWSQAPNPQIIQCHNVVPLDAQIEHFIDVITGTADPLIDITDATRTLALASEIENMLNQSIKPNTL